MATIRMRKDNQIIQESKVKGAFLGLADAAGRITAIVQQQQLMLEVLLDIRELLGQMATEQGIILVVPGDGDTPMKELKKAAQG